MLTDLAEEEEEEDKPALGAEELAVQLPVARVTKVRHVTARGPLGQINTDELLPDCYSSVRSERRASSTRS